VSGGLILALYLIEMLGLLLLMEIIEVDLVARRIMNLREGEFQQEGEIRLRVCWRRIAKKTEETSSKEIDLLSLAFAEVELQT
jgi:hypothetical protein